MGAQQLLLAQMAAAPVVLATLDGAPSNATLSNGNLTVTHSNTSTGGGRSASYKTSGKYYFEVTITARNGQQDAISIGPSGNTYASYFSSGVVIKLDTTNFSTQNIYSNGSGTSLKIGPIVNGSIVGVAVDMVAKKVWGRVDGGLWDGLAIGVENPASNLGGATIQTAGGHAPLLTFEGTGTVAGNNYTVNFGQSAFAYAAPAGFGVWTL